MSKPRTFIPLLIAIIFVCQSISALARHSWLVAALSILSAVLWVAVYYVKEKNNG